MQDSTDAMANPDYTGQIAIVGMSGRFPRAGNLDEFWANLRDGVECATTFSDDELEIAPLLRSYPGLVRKRPIIEDADLFDASFFGYTPREAELIDPQQRLFLECSWEALEHAGYDASRFGGAIGVFGGGSISTYFLNNIFGNTNVLRSIGLFPVLLGNDKDFLKTRVSYKLDLRGPSVNVLTGCSTSLVAIHLACQSLLNGECDMALAGGANVSYPQKMGYFYTEGSVNSPDGLCRTFDARANGTIPGDGVGIVLLRRLRDALDSSDCIHAIIRGSAVNNDGGLKAGFTAPSVEGQAAVISEALAVSRVSPEQISYVESHGTGTALGDPIEVSALQQAFRTDRRNYCALGAAKPNIGHTDAAAGVAGLIKVVFAMKYGLIPPMLHFERPNPRIELESSPFFINTNAIEWRPAESRRFAGVSSFGIGGTNAHVVLEEPPAIHSLPVSNWQLLVFSAKSESALDSMADNLAHFFEERPQTNLADAAFTLQTGRRRFEHRRFAVARDTSEAVQALQAGRESKGSTYTSNASPSVVFLFPGQGAQYHGMGRQLYDTYASYRQIVDECAAFLNPQLGLDLRYTIFTASTMPVRSSPLYQTALTQPALFVTEYALARLLMDWGLKPDAMLGHSIGEYVAACIAGVFSLEDALSIVALRGRLIQQQGDGAMLAVTANVADVAPFLTKDVAIAAVNSPSQVVLSGPSTEIEGTAERLATANLPHQALHTSRAFHSPMLEPVLYPFTQAVRRVRLSAPQIPFISNLTGRWITPAEATDPLYWARHLREPVLFSNGVQELLKQEGRVFVEVGPGKVLSALGRMHVTSSAPDRFISAMRQANDDRNDCAVLLGGLGELWKLGAEFEWPRLSLDERRSRIPLPTYPFERKRYLIRPADVVEGNAGGRSELLNGDRAVAEQAASDGVRSEREGRPKLTTEYQPPTNEIEERLVLMWQDMLGIEPIGIHDNFFELGGHSLMAAQVIARLQSTFPVKVSIRDLMAEGSTIAQLAQLIDRLLLERLESLSEEEAVQLLQSAGAHQGAER